MLLAPEALPSPPGAGGALTARPMGILITGGQLSGNLGATAMSMLVIQEVRRLCPQARIRFISKYHEEEKGSVVRLLDSRCAVELVETTQRRATLVELPLALLRALVQGVHECADLAFLLPAEDTERTRLIRKPPGLLVSFLARSGRIVRITGAIVMLAMVVQLGAATTDNFDKQQEYLAKDEYAAYRNVSYFLATRGPSARTYAYQARVIHFLSGRRVTAWSLPSHELPPAQTFPALYASRGGFNWLVLDPQKYPNDREVLRAAMNMSARAGYVMRRGHRPIFGGLIVYELVHMPSGGLGSSTRSTGMTESLEDVSRPASNGPESAKLIEGCSQ